MSVYTYGMLICIRLFNKMEQLAQMNQLWIMLDLELYENNFEACVTRLRRRQVITVVIQLDVLFLFLAKWVQMSRKDDYEINTSCYEAQQQFNIVIAHKRSLIFSH